MRRLPEPVTAAEVRAARFQATKFREGYDQDEIDAFMTRAAEALEAKASGRPWTHLLTRDGVLNAKFQATKFREGYDQDQVDDLLDRVVASLRDASGEVTAYGPGPWQPAGLAGGRMNPATVVMFLIIAVILGVVTWAMLAR